ncbi:alpha/beta hydrolase [Tolypothrix campylonemoides VB511288]|nr:alpha/beta hydrolase [Tolypothrix campylonemoides VB511288]
MTRPPIASSKRRVATTRILALLALVAVAIAVVVARDPERLIRAELVRQRVAAGLELRRATLDDHTWVYAASDDAPRDAPTLVLVHGFTGSKENWYPLASRLRGRVRLVVPDLPGWGESTRIADADYGYAAQAARLARFVGTVARVDGREVVLAGHSMGGGIVALAASTHPRSADRVALIDAAGVRFRDNAFGRAVLAGRNPFEVRDAATLRRYLDTVFFDRDAMPSIPWPADRAYIARRRAQAAFEQRVLDRIGRSDERVLPGDRADGIAQPTLLLWCAQDAVIDPSAMALYAARIPHARRALLEGCGHMSIVERPDDVAALLDLLITGDPR